MRRELSERQNEIIELAAEGMTRREAAEELGITEATVKVQWQWILLKLEAKNQAHAVAIWLEGAA